MKTILDLVTACYPSVQNILSPSLDVIFGCETWSVTLREEHKLSVLENRVLEKIFGSKREEVTEILGSFMFCASHQMYKIRIINSSRMRWVGHMACMGEKRNVYSVLVGKPGEKRTLVRPRNGL
jgi:hypothetical protein